MLRRQAIALASIAISLLAVPGCAAERVPGAAAAGPVRVLFIGNSLTAGNDLPQLVQAMAAAGGVRLEVESVTAGGFSLEDHWNGGAARKKLAESPWTFVVLQQGPSSLPESQTNLREWATKWAAEIRRRGAKPALYMVWPFEGQANGFALVSKSYRSAAKSADARILPAGEAWQQALKRDPKSGLYVEDKLHPTPAGTYLAALVIAHGVAGIDVGSAPAALKLASADEFKVPEKQAEELRKAAEKVLAE
jgi:hypothetical protein